jgi:hypothetical protein
MFTSRWWNEPDTAIFYETVAPWPDEGGDVATCIIARTLLMANDVIHQPEWRHAAPEIYERGERRIRDMLGRLRERGEASR